MTNKLYILHAKQNAIILKLVTCIMLTSLNSIRARVFEYLFLSMDKIIHIPNYFWCFISILYNFVFWWTFAFVNKSNVYACQCMCIEKKLIPFGGEAILNTRKNKKGRYCKCIFINFTLVKAADTGFRHNWFYMPKDSKTWLFIFSSAIVFLSDWSHKQDFISTMLSHCFFPNWICHLSLLTTISCH